MPAEMEAMVRSRTTSHSFTYIWSSRGMVLVISEISSFIIVVVYRQNIVPIPNRSLTMAFRIPFSNWQFCNKVILNVPSNTPLS